MALGSSPTLKTLNLSSNRITEEGAKHIASMLVDPGCRLRSLFLSGRLDTTKQLEAAEDDEDDEEEEGNDAKVREIANPNRASSGGHLRKVLRAGGLPPQQPCHLPASARARKARYSRCAVYLVGRG